MKKSTIILLALVLLSINHLNAQIHCSGTTLPPETIVINLTGLSTSTTLGGAGNPVFLSCFPSAVTMDNVGVEWANTEPGPIAPSLCNETLFGWGTPNTIGVQFTTSTTTTSGPCAPGNATLVDLNALALTVTTDANGCVIWSAWETLDSNPAGIDQTFVDGTVTLYGCPQGSILALPLILEKFEGAPMGKYNELKWTTSSEENTDYFEIQRSRDGYDWKKIGEHSAQGHSELEVHYSFTDSEPLSNAYYRLRMFDLDKKESVSESINLKNGVGQVYVYPNPTKGVLEIELNNSVVQEMKLLNLQGAVMKSINRSQRRIDMSNLPAGFYYLQLISPSGVQNIKVIKE